MKIPEKTPWCVFSGCYSRHTSKCAELLESDGIKCRILEDHELYLPGATVAIIDAEWDAEHYEIIIGTLESIAIGEGTLVKLAGYNELFDIDSLDQVVVLRPLQWNTK